jgi:predicted nucleic acid-binding protein
MESILLDASAIMAVIAEEPEKIKVISLTKGKQIASISAISYEIANALTKMMKRHTITEDAMLEG